MLNLCGVSSPKRASHHQTVESNTSMTITADWSAAPALTGRSLSSPQLAIVEGSYCDIKPGLVLENLHDRKQSVHMRYGADIIVRHHGGEGR
jgi:hypothetical protein